MVMKMMRRRKGAKGGKKLTPKQKTEVKRLVGFRTELKYLDDYVFGAGYTSNTSAGTIAQIQYPTQGVADTQRIGDGLFIKRLEIRGAMVRPQVYTAAGGNTNATQSSNVGRLIIIQWKPNSVPAFGQILINYMMPYGPHAGYGWDLRQQYDVVYDKSFGFDPNGTAVHTFRKTIYKGFNKKVQFSGGTSNGTNCFYALIISDNGTTDTNQVATILHSRVVYSDA